MTPPDIWQNIASAGLPSLLMAVAVWWLSRGNSELVKSLNDERGERLRLLEEHVTECNEDRSRLWERMTHLAAAAGPVANETFSTRHQK